MSAPINGRLHVSFAPSPNQGRSPGQFIPAFWKELRSPNSSSARNGLDKAWLCGGIIENLANFVDGGAQAVIEVHKRIGGPKLLTNLFSGDELARSLQEQGEQLERLRLQPDSYPLFSQLANLQVCFVGTKRDPTWRGKRGGHNAHSHQWRREEQGARAAAKETFVSREGK